MRKLLLASRNKRKLIEMKDILSDIPFSLLTLYDIEFGTDIPETGNTFLENATIKAEFAGEKTKKLTLAEDSGLVIDALGGRPGIYSARYEQGTDMDRIAKVLKELKGIPKGKRTARFVSAVAIYDPATKKIFQSEGISEGLIAEKPIGEGGFGYDPIFYNFDLAKTNGELSLTEKNKVSHRARALRKVRRYLARQT